ncbi:MAG: hypothetical protein ACI84R_004106 [Candidatus Azotimanducaceae bacterium]
MRATKWHFVRTADIGTLNACRAAEKGWFEPTPTNAAFRTKVSFNNKPRLDMATL